MRFEAINESVAVGAVFAKPNIKPKWFLWQGRKHEVESVNMVWRGREGEAPLMFFSVSCGDNVYELKLNQKTLEWLLVKVAMEG